jgi:homeobox-leucine zipper protein
MQNVPPALLIRFLREHRSEWADCDIDADAAAAFHTSTRNRSAGHRQLPLPLAHSVEQEEVKFLKLFILALEGKYFSWPKLMPQEVSACE